jgi:hypothetical protein
MEGRMPVDDRLAMFVGLAAYEAAGGTILCDARLVASGSMREGFISESRMALSAEFVWPSRTTS